MFLNSCFPPLFILYCALWQNIPTSAAQLQTHSYTRPSGSNKRFAWYHRRTFWPHDVSLFFFVDVVAGNQKKSQKTGYEDKNWFSCEDRRRYGPEKQTPAERKFYHKCSVLHVYANKQNAEYSNLDAVKNTYLYIYTFLILIQFSNIWMRPKSVNKSAASNANSQITLNICTWNTHSRVYKVKLGHLILYWAL